jgi:hypothetical protein
LFVLLVTLSDPFGIFSAVFTGSNSLLLLLLLPCKLFESFIVRIVLTIVSTALSYDESMLSFIFARFLSASATIIEDSFSASAFAASTIFFLLHR